MSERDATLYPRRVRDRDGPGASSGRISPNEDEAAATQDLGAIASTVSLASDPALATTACALDRALPLAGVALGTGVGGLGRYHHLGLLGEGGMGRVDRLRDRDLMRDVAAKHLRVELADDPRMLAQFVWEARILAYLDHPNIVPVHDLALTPDGELFLTMKLVRGHTLEKVIADACKETDASSSTTKRLRCFLQLCNAVSFAHSRGVLHRDLKPANVMLGAYGEVLVTDWGLALPLPDTSGDELRSAMPPEVGTISAGTPLYMSPEQVRGDPLDARSDLYALGVMLYELIALTVPYQATSAVDVLDQVARGEVVPLSQMAPGTSHSLVAVVDKAMAHDAVDRYPDVRSFADDLETVLEGHTPSSEHVSIGRRLGRYYVARDPAIAGLRVVDIDMWVLSATLLGAGVALSLAHWLAPGAWVGWALMGAAALVLVPPTLRWRRLRASRRSGE